MLTLLLGSCAVAWFCVRLSLWRDRVAEKIRGSGSISRLSHILFKDYSREP